MKIINENFAPKLCMGILFDQGSIPISNFGFGDVVDTCLLTGFTHAIKIFIDHLASSLEDTDIEKEPKILNNFLNTGFYLSQFTNKKENKSYSLLFRPINNDKFSKYWIEKILTKITFELENADNIAQKTYVFLKSFNKLLANELKLIEYIYNHKNNKKSKYKLIFRESGVRAGSFNDPKIEKIINYVINNFDVSSDVKFQLNGNEFVVERKEINKINYYQLKINSKSKKLKQDN